MPPPAMITGSLFLEEDGDAIEFSFGIHEIDALVRDPKCIPARAQPVLDQRPIQPLFLVAEFNHRERRADAQLAVRPSELHDVGHLVHGAREWLARMRARMAQLLYAQLEQRTVVVDDRRGLVRVFLALLERHPVGRIVGEQREPVLVALRVEKPRFVIEELLGRHYDDCVMYSSQARIWPRMNTSLVPVAPRRTPGSSTSRP